jgi:hypothetical protein
MRTAALRSAVPDVAVPDAYVPVTVAGQDLQPSQGPGGMKSGPAGLSRA